MKEFEEYKDLTDEDAHYFLDSVAKEVAQTYVEYERMVLWEVPHRFGLHILSKNKILSVSLMEKAIADLEKCEREYDTLGDKDKNTYRKIQSNMFQTLVTKNRLDFERHCDILKDDTNVKIMGTVLDLLAKPESCTESFHDSMATEILNTLNSNFSQQAVQKRICRVKKIKELLEKEKNDET